MKEAKNNEHSEIRKDWEKPMLKVLNFKKTEGSNSVATGEETGYVELES